MAVEKIVRRSSDFSGTKESKTTPVSEYKFSLNGTRYAIDLTEKEWNDHVMTVLSPVLTFARIVGAQNVADDGETVPGSPDAIREWGRANGFEVQDRGKLAKALKDAYKAAHPNENGEDVDSSDNEEENVKQDA